MKRIYTAVVVTSLVLGLSMSAFAQNRRDHRSGMTTNLPRTQIRAVHTVFHDCTGPFGLSQGQSTGRRSMTGDQSNHTGNSTNARQLLDGTSNTYMEQEPLNARRNSARFSEPANSRPKNSLTATTYGRGSFAKARGRRGR
jgi:hypothetical protein